MIRGRFQWVFGWALLIEALLLWPTPPQISERLFGIGLDKVAHITMFAVLAGLWAWASASTRRLFWPAVGAVAFGALTEWQQHFVPTRSMELGDFLADSSGVALALVLFAVMARWRREPGR